MTIRLVIPEQFGPPVHLKSNPGSLNAHIRGCWCDPAANDFGGGYKSRTGVWAIDPHCPMHMPVLRDLDLIQRIHDSRTGSKFRNPDPET